MKVEIWSDVMCPFCYIGKRKFENALTQFPGKNQVEVIWKSFQLDPSTVTNPELTTIQHLADKKGWSIEQAREATQYTTKLAKDVGLTFNFDKAVVANSFDAHRLSHLAKTHGKQDELEEQLFAAYFTDGKNTADHATLTELAAAIGLDAHEVGGVLSSNQYAQDVQSDIHRAQQVGVRGVPFFVFDNKYAISGAQETPTFLQGLTQAYAEWEKSNQAPVQLVEGAVCTPDGCDPEN